QARNRYTYFASAAKKAGYEQIAGLFLETADNEKEHAKRFFKFLEGGELEIQAAYPAGIIGDTQINLLASAQGENLEWTKLYKEAGDTAREEGFDEIADLFYNISKVEKEHEKRYRKLLENLKNGKIFKKDKSVEWKCRNCGFHFEGDTAPEECPACKHPQSYFEVFCETY
ncbi:rubrerythrin, partial [bacterium]